MVGPLGEEVNAGPYCKAAAAGPTGHWVGWVQCRLKPGKMIQLADMGVVWGKHAEGTTTNISEKPAHDDAHIVTRRGLGD
jgi:hypothetical protein